MTVTELESMVRSLASQLACVVSLPSLTPEVRQSSRELAEAALLALRVSSVA